jgi:hypothetical protein
MPLELVSPLKAMEHLRAYVEDESNVILKMQQASSIVMRHLGLAEVPTGQYDETTSPPTLHPVYYDDEQSPEVLVVAPNVQAAVLLVLGELYEGRESSSSEPLTNSVMALLSTEFDPPFA